MLIGQKLAMTLQSSGSKPMFRYLAKPTSYKEAYSYINRYSYFLQKEISHNKKVLVMMTNCPHLAYTFFALANTKNCAIIMDPATPEPKIVDKIKEMGIQAIIASDDMMRTVQEMVKRNGIMIPIISCESRRWGEYDETYRLPPSVSAKDDDVIAIFDTAGTSGTPKQVPYTHVMLQQAALALRSAYKVGPIDTFFTYQQSLSKPFYFIHGLIFPLLSGAGVLITDQTAPEELGKEILEGKATRVLLKGQQIKDFFDQFKAINFRVPTVRSVSPEPYPWDPNVENYLTEEYSVKVLWSYGSVETCFAVCCRSFEEPEGFETVGQFLPGFKTRVVDEQGDDIPPKKEQKGQLLVSGASVARTYWEDKENTKMNMRGQWFFTGDHVEVDKKGHVKFLDRKENVFRVVDEVIYPGPIEKKLLEIPGIEMASVIMLKDAVGKPMVTAFLKKRTGAEISTTDLNKFCEANLSERQRPRSFAFIDEPPVDSRGLINKFKLRFEHGT